MTAVALYLTYTEKGCPTWLMLAAMILDYCLLDRLISYLHTAT